MTALDPAVRQMFIDGAWCDAASGTTIETRDPATNRVLASVPAASVTE